MIITDPSAIEARSMEIIESELKTEIPPENKAVVKRVIHATADFDYAENLAFSDGAVGIALDALRRGCRRFVIGIGGSATTDGGMGMLQALGYSFLRDDGTEAGR